MLFEGEPRYSPRSLRLLLRKHNYSIIRVFREIAAINRMSRKFRTIFRCRYVLIEPVMHPELIRFVGRFPSIFIGGVSSCNPSSQIQLLMAKNSLGNSIIPSKPGLSGEVRETFNINFPDIYRFAIQTYIVSGDCTSVIIRMNAEGVEGPIIDFVTLQAAVKPTVIAGSLGDIRKCFGREAEERAAKSLEDARIPFIYFTSDPRTWEVGLDRLLTCLSR